MWHHIERVQETSVVQNPPVHIVGHRVILVPTKCQGHGGTGTLQGTGRRKRGRRRTRERGETDRFKREALRACRLFNGKTDGVFSRSR